jgi:hypothetical protein
MTRPLSAPHSLAAVLLMSGAVLVVSVAAEDLTGKKKASSDASSGRFTTTNAARVTVQKEANNWWLVSPAGKRFFSLGICEFNQGSDRQSYNPDKPSYAAWRHYDSAEAWASSSLKRLNSWGFTTAGGWSDYKTLAKSGEHEFWMTPVLSLGARSGAPWFDMWNEKVIRRIDELAKETITPFRGNSRVIGYYSDNEIGWWNAILWKMTLEQPPTSGQRQRLIRLTREVYADDWNALLADFEQQNAASWEELDRGGTLWLRPGGNGIRAMRRFLGIVAERYYEVMRDAIRKFDPDAMYLGDRYQSFYYPELALGARQHVDVISTNLNATWNDGTFLNSFLDTLHKLTGKPLIITEFYMAAAENTSGNQNKVGGFPIVPTQRERGDALVNTLDALVRLPYVVGADWFQFYDEPPHGRKTDGEDYNFGLVDIHDRPYTEVTAAFASANLSTLKAAPAARPPDATAGVPPAPTDPLGDFRSTTAIKRWDRKRGFVPPATEHPVGDLYICWSPTALYLATCVIDIVEPDYYKNGNIPDVDRAIWTIQLNGRAAVTARIGADKDPAIDNPAVRVASLSGTYHEVRCITAIELKADQLGKDRFAAGDRIKLESTFITFGRAGRVKWDGEFVLAK